MDTIEKVTESNRIERIRRPPTPEEIAEHERFMALTQVTVDDMVRFVKVYQPNARMRDKAGMDIRVGNHHPERGGPLIRQHLESLLENCNARNYSPFEAHVHYEMLHPFNDGNGRSGRALWYWMMGRCGDHDADLGFLHAWYYQSLEHMQGDDDL